MSEPDQIFAGKYRLIAELGRGGMAEVNLAIAAGPAGFNKLIVVKQLRQNLADDTEFLNMFLDEARLAARLNHPNVVHTYEVGAEAGQYFIAMEYLDGQPMQRVVREMSKREGLPLGVYLRIVCDALNGLHYAHELTDYDGTPLNVVHRDISPHNIFVTYEGQTKVVDFGIAKALNSSSETRSGVIKGKISYMSPEQSRSEPLDRRSDLFAMGIILWEGVTGHRLWKGLADVTVLQRLMVNQAVPSPSSINPEVSPLLEKICMKALAPLPADRYETAADMQNDIENAMLEMKLRVTSRDVGKLLAEKFSTERAEIRSIIDAQLKTTSTESSRIARLSTQSQNASGTSHTPISQRNQTEQIGLTGEQSSLRATLSLPSDNTMQVSSKEEAKSVWGRPAFLLLSVALVGALGLLAFNSRASHPAEPVAAAAVKPIILNLHASPAGARLFLDDAPLPSNPYSGSRPRDTVPHFVRIEADGYISKNRPISFENDVSLDFELERAPVAEPSRVEAPSGTASSKADDGKRRPAPAVNRPTEAPRPTETARQAEPTTAPPPPRKNANVKIDTDNPWQH